MMPNPNVKSRIVVDGAIRLKQSPEIQAKLLALRQCIHARYSAELTSASFFRRCIIRWRMALEYRRGEKQILPSSESLYVHTLWPRTQITPRHSPTTEPPS